MKLVIVLLTHIDNLPPARNLLISLTKINVKVELVTMYSSALPKQIYEANNINIHDVQQKISSNKIEALKNRFIRRKKVRSIIEKLMSDQDVVWTVTDYDAMEVGPILNNYRHVMQLMELIHDIPFFDEMPFLKAHIEKYGRTAEMIIVPEYNRAHIQKAYWKLKKTPKVLPNKPTVDSQKYNITNISPEVAEVLRKIGNRKIILYQGVFGYERVLDQFIEAVESLGNDYCMLLMGRNDDELKKILDKYPKTFFIPFIAAPNHLAITSRAYIGILSYVITNNIRHYDPLNALYCAPNKLYEYACFGVPMIGNDIPGLRIPFEKNNIGRCAELKVDSIVNTIREIENDYTDMSKSCIDFYNSIDMDCLVEKIIKELSLGVSKR